MDADHAVGVVMGAVAGVRFGRDAVPVRRLDGVAYREEPAEAPATTDIEAPSSTPPAVSAPARST